jgi:hypothetical protein
MKFLSDPFTDLIARGLKRSPRSVTRHDVDGAVQYLCHRLRQARAEAETFSLLLPPLYESRSSPCREMLRRVCSVKSAGLGAKT